MSTVIEPTATPAVSVKAPPFGKFFLPGPTEVRHDVLYAMTQQMIGHRGKDVEDLMARVAPKLQAVFRTTRPVYTVTSSATGLMEAGVRNATLKRVLCLVNGSFSERFYKASVNSGIAADKLEVPFGEYVSPELLADTLKQKEYDVVTIVHSETSTGVLNPIRDLAAAAHASGDVAVVIDTVSSLAAGAVESDAWELDSVLTGSQKALALPPGLAFCTANERVFARARQSERRGLYFDLLEFDEYFKKNQTPNTPAVSLLYALDLQLDHMMAEGVEARWARHAEMAAYTWGWAEQRGLKVFAPAGYRSPGVTCILMPEGTKGSVVVGALKAKGFVLATGYGALKDDMVRVGHMGEHTLGEVQAVLEALGEVMST
ncbi:MAG: alanine--glyoxylate aminotransferase family protein [Gemmatimonadetes bacterium]|nr:alanine--glyoxylate aminotransferase family protein [Gemmatimonadota bacterium]MBK8060795.1 alanine--glyoxylate aminotransferase family protein [Gemmatimonadota bacterium]